MSSITRIPRKYRTRFWDEWRDSRSAQRELDSFAFVRGFSLHYRQAVTLSLMSTLVLLTFFLRPTIFPRIDNATIVTGFGALVAVVLGIQQWHASRDEVTLDRFYDRLEITNKILDQSCAAREFAGPWLDTNGQDADERYQRSMYVYRELDNLEYAIAKYRIGFMSPSNARRCLRTFRARCTTSSTFCELVEQSAITNLGYDHVTRMVVKCCIARARTPIEEQVAVGMRVQSADGQELGTIASIAEDCSHLEIRRGWLRRRAFDIPGSAVGNVAGDVVTLKPEETSVAINDV